jgi:hypothetical protein
MKRDGEALMAMGRDMTTFSKERVRSVQRGPMDVRRARIRGEKTRPPIPAPERMNPIAEPRCAPKYSGAALRIGKYRREDPIPYRRPCVRRRCQT